MRCPRCNAKEVEVIEFTDADKTKTRVYGCNNCREKFTTIERIVTGQRKMLVNFEHY